MSIPTPPVPAGWYPDASNAALQRYWDGSVWTDHTAPAGAAAPASAASSPMTTRTKLIIGGAAVAAVLLIGGIASANGARTEPPVAQDAPAAVVETPAPIETVPPAPTSEPVEEVVLVDSAAFKTEALRDLVDFNKDLSDMDTTLDEDGFWRLLSNYGELSFNLGQLQSHDAPAEYAATWTASLVTLEARLDVLGDAVSVDNSAVTRAAVAAARKQSNAMIAQVTALP